MKRRISTAGVRAFSRAITAVFALCLLATVATVTSPAAAQQRTFYLDRLQVSGAPDDGLVLWRPYVHEKTRFYGAATLGYTLNPLRSGTVTDNPNVEERIDNVVRHQVITHLSAGIEAMNRFTFGLTLPVMLFQEGGDDPRAAGVGEGLERTAVAIHDLRLDARVKVFETGDRKLRLGAGASIWIPTGNAFAFASDDQVTGFLYGMGEYDFGKFLVSGMLGPHFRPDRGILGDESALREVGTEIRWGAGVFFPLRGGELRLGGTLWGTAGVDPGGSRYTDIEWLGELRTHLDDEKRVYLSGGGGTRLATGYGAPDIRLLGQIGTYLYLTDLEPGQRPVARRERPDVEMRDKDTDGDGYPDDIDLCPTVKEDGEPPDPDDGCPGAKDRDHDGIPDDEDKCPDDPEDKDGIQDYDGCPEKDADGDGIADAEDACPTQKGVENKNPKKHGCPKRDKIVETESGIQLLEPIQFETGLAAIKPVSYPILDEVVDVLQGRPDIRMAVHGHTDSVGGHQMNMQLSKNRAAAVVAYLVSKGVKRDRLESEGFGPDKPVASNDTPEGRAKNRRVEFQIIE